jgi:hypothetical protein
MPMLERWHNENTDPLMAQWEALRDRGAPAITPITQESLWQMRQELAAIERERRAAVEPPDEQRVAARREFRDSCHRHRHAVTSINDALSKLERYRRNEIYLLLFDMAAVLKPPTPTQQLLDARFGGRQESADLYHLRLPQLETTAAYRAATAWMSDRAFELENQRSAIAVVTVFPGEETNARTDRMVTALIKRINELERLAVRNAELLGRKVELMDDKLERLWKYSRYKRKEKSK